MKNYTLDELRLLATIPNMTPKKLMLLDSLHCGKDDLLLAEDLLREANVSFITEENSKELGIYRITIMTGIEDFISKNNEQKKEHLRTILLGIQNIADGKNGTHFENREQLINHLNHRHEGHYLRGIRKYLSKEHPDMLDDYEREFKSIIDTIPQNELW